MIDTGRITNINEYGEPVVNCSDLVELVYQGKTIDNLKVNDKRIDLYNNVLSDLNIDWPKLKKLTKLSIAVKDYDTALQSDWYMPDEYKQLDVVSHIKSLAKSDEEKKRVDTELELYVKYGLSNVLRFLVYLIKVMRDNNIVWGVGRGSSVSSYVLYLIGIHKVDSIKYDLDIGEFLKDK